ncbi:hypothetical protein A7K93_11205 [Candidatus Methylacidiphilum fumarolicum]|uniref:Uncharacterized protein n=2 Tax=Candidatus Methylacidiphilum fumarolicum TaxID=591154 RepID=I0JWM4_METFB|nr:hypothetical protein [Candidatus Methylacidiphilum fumarolicum]TFE65832.1 hypothetical protein A7K73_11045 [Candidatus Methylacidiphilum fumarolicum]TFE71195.1 hypothetical protein A7K93_11205 [Candidatus Methylacidiphilum fumarolicum]TFE71646.1 hypothetical protein A7K72_10440 [Candidatus Methylacidiphilum fumarolicum]TFE76880.1 hypothetical protein A7D33_07725 [Candidatus Methylacidiphilum fumarolicum]CAI9085561.1 conserved protein of unknown function [Candidatus Methylacidiphilum fumarol
MQLQPPLRHSYSLWPLKLCFRHRDSSDLRVYGEAAYGNIAEYYDQGGLTLLGMERDIDRVFCIRTAPMDACPPRVPVARRYVEETARAVFQAQKGRHKESSFEYRHTI